MTNYLAQIVTRAKGGEESNPMRPGLRHRYTTESGDSIDSIEADIMPSDSGIFFDKPDTLAADRESGFQVTPNYNSDPASPSEQKTPIFRPSFHKKASPFPYIDKSADKRPAERGKPKNAIPVDPASVETTLTQNQPHGRKLPMMSPANIRTFSGEETTPTEPRHRTPSVIINPEFAPKSTKEIERLSPRESSSVLELRPTAPVAPSPSAARTTKSTEPRLLIGRLKVEVLAAPPVKAQQTKIRKVSRGEKVKAGSDNRLNHSKLRFGLGQL